MIASINAAAVNDIARIVKGSMEVSRNFTAGQFIPHKVPIKRSAKASVGLMFDFNFITCNHIS